VETAGRWPWKWVSAKECVKTHQPNGPGLKMEGIAASWKRPLQMWRRRGASLLRRSVAGDGAWSGEERRSRCK